MENLDEDFEHVLNELEKLVVEIRPRYDRYNSLEELLAARSKDFKLPVEISKKTT